MEVNMFYHIDAENMWTDVTGGFAFIPSWWGGNATTDDFYYEYYL